MIDGRSHMSGRLRQVASRRSARPRFRRERLSRAVHANHRTGVAPANRASCARPSRGPRDQPSKLTARAVPNCASFGPREIVADLILPVVRAAVARQIVYGPRADRRRHGPVEVARLGTGENGLAGGGNWIRTLGSARDRPRLRGFVVHLSAQVLAVRRGHPFREGNLDRDQCRQGFAGRRSAVRAVPRPPRHCLTIPPAVLAMAD